MKNKPFNKIILQIIAIVAMTIDHITWEVFPGYSTHPLAIIFHIIGRLAFPIMAFFIAEGYHYTHNKNKYMLRILIFALISHVPYMLFSPSFPEYGPLCFIPFATGKGITRFLNQGSVLWAYFIGLVMLRVIDYPKFKQWQKTLLVILLCCVSFLSDWSCIGSLIVVVIATNRNNPKKQIIESMLYICLYALVYYFSLDHLYALLQLGVIISVPVIALYNGKKSKNEKINKIFKWFFYIYYPLHLLIIGLLANVF